MFGSPGLSRGSPHSQAGGGGSYLANYLAAKAASSPSPHQGSRTPTTMSSISSNNRGPSPHNRRYPPQLSSTSRARSAPLEDPTSPGRSVGGFSTTSALSFESMSRALQLLKQSSRKTKAIQEKKARFEAEQEAKRLAALEARRAQRAAYMPRRARSATSRSSVKSGNRSTRSRSMGSTMRSSTSTRSGAIDNLSQASSTSNVSPLQSPQPEESEEINGQEDENCIPHPPQLRAPGSPSSTKRSGTPFLEVRQPAVRPATSTSTRLFLELERISEQAENPSPRTVSSSTWSLLGSSSVNPAAPPPKPATVLIDPPIHPPPPRHQPVAAFAQVPARAPLSSSNLSSNVSVFSKSTRASKVSVSSTAVERPKWNAYSKPRPSPPPRSITSSVASRTSKDENRAAPEAAKRRPSVPRYYQPRMDRPPIPVRPRSLPPIVQARVVPESPPSQALTASHSTKQPAHQTGSRVLRPTVSSANKAPTRVPRRFALRRSRSENQAPSPQGSSLTSTLVSAALEAAAAQEPVFIPAHGKTGPMFNGATQQRRAGSRDSVRSSGSTWSTASAPLMPSSLNHPPAARSQIRPAHVPPLSFGKSPSPSENHRPVLAHRQDSNFYVPPHNHQYGMGAAQHHHHHQHQQPSWYQQQSHDAQQPQQQHRSPGMSKKPLLPHARVDGRVTTGHQRQPLSHPTGMDNQSNSVVRVHNSAALAAMLNG